MLWGFTPRAARVFDKQKKPYPQALQYYIDYDAITRDLGMDYSEIRIGGTNYIYRCD